MIVNNSDDELFALICKSLKSSTLSDTMTNMGFSNRVLPKEIHPLSVDLGIIYGRAMPVLDGEPAEDGDLKHQAYGKLIESIEDLKENEVYISSGGPLNVARLGDILIERARIKGAKGIILNSCIRNKLASVNVGLPIFSRGSYCYGLQKKHNIVDYRCKIDIDGVVINPGDLIFGDADGICIIPKEFEEEIIQNTLMQQDMEKSILNDIVDGMCLHEAFKKNQIIE
ncbi:RraA family protein [Vibrio mediterranei]|uniref:RraA family protein n=1 Tax=Vibrio mediterranei TaxID=689 RepID=UPI001EFD9434|nr:RraA family protein [Vibrio mediterranei]MCG9629022.1 RraA family protein [Vibrio mediterranei]